LIKTAGVDVGWDSGYFASLLYKILNRVQHKFQN